MPLKLSLAPLQGFTDYIFRKTFAQYFSEVDVFYSPFLRFESDHTVKNSKLKDVLPENNEGIHLIPQILTNSAEEFIDLTNRFKDFGYHEVNWNLGCPYPMVSKHKLGSGLLPYPEMIDEVLDKAFNKTQAKISIKMRVGYQSKDEIFSVLPILEKYPLTEIIVHPRIGTQIYKGIPDLDAFEKSLLCTRHQMGYNGDIESKETWQNLSLRFPQIQHFMIGRALISNPFLAQQIKGIEIQGDKKQIFSNFHDSLFQQYATQLSGSSHLLNKMMFFWEYFSLSFTNSHKVFKRIKKTTSIDKYHMAVMENLRSEDFH